MIRFNFPYKTSYIYLNGDNEYFAHELSHRGIGEVYALVYPHSSEPFHFVVKYKNKYIDIIGIWDQQDLIQEWDNRMNFILYGSSCDLIPINEIANMAHFVDMNYVPYDAVIKIVDSIMMYIESPAHS